MGVELTFFGGAGTLEHGELGGIQLLIHDLQKQTKFFLDYGQPPDRTNAYYSFPYRIKQFELAGIAEELGLYASIPSLFRFDLENARGNRNGPLPADGILLTHAHYDHAGGFSLIRHDMPIFMHPLTQMILYVWQYLSGRTINQFVDVIQQMARAPKKYGKEKFISGEEAVLPRDIRLFETQTPFKIGNIDIIPYLVDHSLAGSSGFIFDTSEGRVALSGDFRLRGRRRQDTEKFVKAARDVDYFFMEGSLLHFGHYGTEEDITDVVSDLIKGKSFVGISYPPRDLDRILTLYNVCKKTGRMLVITPGEAKLLQMFNGINGYPRLSNKYIGILLKPKGKGRIDTDEEFQDLIEADYYKWERHYLKLRGWDANAGHEGRPTRVSLEDIEKNQDKFMLHLNLADMISFLNKIKPRENSIFIRSVPAPWTKEMEVQEDQLVAVLKHFGMYDGPKEDALAQLYTTGRKADLFARQGKAPVHRLYQVHVTGHMNRYETRETIESLGEKTIIVPYHSMRPLDFAEDVARSHKVFIPLAKRTYTLKEIRENAR